MADPQTVNTGLFVPLTGADVDTWGEDALNPNFISIDAMFGGVQAVAVSTLNVTLTAPAGFTATPTAGPTQSQNRVLRFTGILLNDVMVTLPLPGAYIIENLTSGNFVLSFRGATATEVIGTPQGECLEIYNDGANVRFVNMGRMGSEEMWAGLTAMPAWVTACTVKPYLLEDGTVYNFSDYPALGARLTNKFGGNGVTTFGVPDRRGRMSLPYDGTGTRITVAGSGINGQTLGASIDSQQATITSSNMLPSISSGGANNISVAPSGGNVPFANGTPGIQNLQVGNGIGFFVPALAGGVGSWIPLGTLTGINNISVAFSNPAPAGHPNVQPSIVVGISVIKT